MLLVLIEIRKCSQSWLYIWLLVLLGGGGGAAIGREIRNCPVHTGYVGNIAYVFYTWRLKTECCEKKTEFAPELCCFWLAVERSGSLQAERILSWW